MPESPRSHKVIYSDFRADMELHPVSSDLGKKTNEESVKESIRNILLTDKGERPFQHDIGSDIRRMLFEPLTPDTLIVFKRIIKDSIINYEPRANLIDVQVTGAIDTGRVDVTIVFNVINVERAITLSVTLTRVR